MLAGCRPHVNGAMHACGIDRAPAASIASRIRRSRSLIAIGVSLPVRAPPPPCLRRAPPGRGAPAPDTHPRGTTLLHVTLRMRLASTVRARTRHPSAPPVDLDAVAACDDRGRAGGVRGEPVRQRIAPALGRGNARAELAQRAQQFGIHLRRQHQRVVQRTHALLERSDVRLERCDVPHVSRGVPQGANAARRDSPCADGASAMPTTTASAAAVALIGPPAARAPRWRSPRHRRPTGDAPTAP